MCRMVFWLSGWGQNDFDHSIFVMSLNVSNVDKLTNQLGDMGEFAFIIFCNFSRQNSS
jgi:hypothetical protein